MDRAATGNAGGSGHGAALRKLRQPMLFAAVGGLNTAIDLGLFYLLTHFAGVPPLLANVVSFSTGAINSYLMNSRLIFRSESESRSAGSIARFAAVTICSLALSQLLLWAALRIGIVPLAAKIIATVLIFAFSFLATKYLVFGGGGGRSRMTVSERHVPALAFGLAAIVTAIPPLLVRVPPMLDYPNHYVRMWLLAGGAQLQPVAQMYRVDWGNASTNIAIDLIAAVLGMIAPITVIGPVSLIAALLLPVAGIAALVRVLGGRIGWWHVGCVLFAWNWVFFAGFLSFCISLGLAMLGAAAMIALAARPLAVRIPASMAIGAAVLVAHPFGLLLYALILGGIAIGPSIDTLGSMRRLRETMVRLAGAAFPLVLLVLLFWLLSPARPGEHVATAGPGLVWGDHGPSALVSILLGPFKSYRLSLDLPFVALLMLPLALCMVVRRINLHFGLTVALGVLVVGSLLMPKYLLGTGGMDTRLPAMLGLVMAIAFRPDAWMSGRRATVAALLALLVVSAKAALIGDIWVSRAADFASLDRALAVIPEKARILPLQYQPAEASGNEAPLGRFVGRTTPAFWHYPVLAIERRHAFVPTLFSARGKQPIEVLPPYAALAVPEGVPADIGLLTRPAAADQAMTAYLRDWQSCFDYAVILNADSNEARGVTLPPALRLVTDAGFVRTYRIERKGSSPLCD